MFIGNKKYWLKISKNNGSKKFYYSKLSDGFLLHWAFISVICKCKIKWWERNEP